MGLCPVSEWLTVASRLVPCKWRLALLRVSIYWRAHAKPYSSYQGHNFSDQCRKALKCLSFREGGWLISTHLRTGSLSHQRASSWSLPWKTHYFEILRNHPGNSYPVFVTKHHHPPCPKFYSLHNYTISCDICIRKELYLLVSLYQTKWTMR